VSHSPPLFEPPAQIITTLELKSPSSLERGDIHDQMEIVLDDMDPQLFEQISKYAAEKALTRKRGGHGVSNEAGDAPNKKKRKK